MSSPITFSGFNNIDFSSVVNSLMAAASQPLTDLQTRQNGIKAQINTVGTLANKIDTLDTAVKTLADATQFSAYGATVTDSSAASVSTNSDAVPGHYDLVVNELARAQVTASASTSPDANTTAIASGGSITINGVQVSVSSSTTLKGLADAINAKTGVGVRASVVQSGISAYKSILSGTSTGVDGAFTVQNALTGGSGLAFTDTDADGSIGNSPADNATQATNADIVVNGVEMVGSSNTFTSAIPGATLTVTKKDPLTTVGVDVSQDSTALETQIQSFVSAYNDLTKFFSDQSNSAAQGSASSIGQEPFVRALHQQMRSIVTSAYGSGTLTRLSAAGIEATRDGTLQLNETVFDTALQDHPDDVKQLFNGSGGAYASMQSALDSYQASSGMITTAKNRMSDSVDALDTQIANTQARLAIERTSLQQEFTAADTTMTDLKSQSASLSNVGSSISSF